MKILQENSTHQAIKQNGQIEIWTKGCEIPGGFLNGEWIEGLTIKSEFLYPVSLEDEDDLFAIFERLDENNRINRAEANAEF